MRLSPSGKIRLSLIACMLAATLIAAVVIVHGCMGDEKQSPKKPDGAVTDNGDIQPASPEDIAPPVTPEPAKRTDISVLIEEFDYTVMENHIRELSVNIPTRFAGSPEERRAAEYIESEFNSYGYVTFRQSFVLDDGLESVNVVAHSGIDVFPPDLPTIIIGAHYDSKKPESPGANDNGTGVAMMLFLSEKLAEFELNFNIVWVAFGAEEIIDGVGEHHHYGSRHFVKELRDDDRLGIIAMASIDMIGVGTRFNIDNMGLSSPWFKDILTDAANSGGYPTFDDLKKPWSDHEAFEYAGFPVAYVHWRFDPDYHTKNDVMDNIDPHNIKVVYETMVTGLEMIDQKILTDPGSCHWVIN